MSRFDYYEIFEREKALDAHKNMTCDPSLCWYCINNFGLKTQTEQDEHEQGVSA